MSSLNKNNNSFTVLLHKAYNITDTDSFDCLLFVISMKNKWM